MKKILTALIVGLIICAGIKVEAAQFTQEQFSEMLSVTAQKSAAESKALALDATTFQKNFNAFMTSFIKDSNAGDDTPTLEEIFLIREPLILQTDTGNFLAKDFLNRIAVVGSVEADGKLKTLNFFSTPAENKNEMVVTILVFQAFTQGISPDLDVKELLGELEKNPGAPVIRSGVKFLVSKQGNLEVITAVAE